MFSLHPLRLLAVATAVLFVVGIPLYASWGAQVAQEHAAAQERHMADGHGAHEGHDHSLTIHPGGAEQGGHPHSLVLRGLAGHRVRLQCGPDTAVRLPQALAEQIQVHSAGGRLAVWGRVRSRADAERSPESGQDGAHRHGADGEMPGGLRVQVGGELSQLQIGPNTTVLASGCALNLEHFQAQVGRGATLLFSGAAKRMSLVLGDGATLGQPQGQGGIMAVGRLELLAGEGVQIRACEAGSIHGLVGEGTQIHHKHGADVQVLAEGGYDALLCVE